MLYHYLFTSVVEINFFYIHINLKDNGTTKMVQHLRVFATKLDYQSWGPRTHIVPTPGHFALPRMSVSWYIFTFTLLQLSYTHSINKITTGTGVK